MLKKLQFKGFKNFKDEMTVDLSGTREYSFNDNLVKNKLLNKVLIYGKNNTGKSNLGAAIMDVTLHLTDNDGIGNRLYNYYLNGDSKDKFAEFSYTFVFDGDEIVYHYRKVAPETMIFEEIFVNGEQYFVYDYETGEYNNNIPGAMDIDISKNNTGYSMLKFIYNNVAYKDDEGFFHKMMTFVNNMLWFRSLERNEFMGKTSGRESLYDFIIKNNLIGDFERFLRDCGQDFRLSTMPYGDRTVLSVKYKHTEAPFGEVASNGTLALWLFYYWMQKSTEIAFLFLDEFDAFYHYELSEHILNYVNEKSNFQSILTTHNIHLMSNELMRPDCYLILEDGKLSSLADRTNKTIREAHNLEKMLLGGEFES